MISSNQYTDMIFTLLKPVLVTGLIAIVASISIAYAVYFYNKSRNVKEKFSTYELIFLFGIIGAVVYLISTRKKEANFEYTGDKKKHKIVSVILAVVCVAVMVVNMSGVLLDVIIGENYLEAINILTEGYYDRNGINYEYSEDVIYYTEDGYKFKITTDSNGSAICSQLTTSYDGTYKEKYEINDCFVDKNGYLVFFTDNELEMDDNVDGVFYYYDSNNEYYASVGLVYWDAEGKLCEY